jgi:acetoin utilization deacetylase AcuC-like enzyme
VHRDHIVNTPLQAGTDGAAFRQAIERDWLPALARHRPQLILVSAGFDGHRLDPLAQLLLDETDYRWVTELIVDQAERHAGGRVVSTLEGGYDLSALARSAAVHIETLMAD